MKFYLLFLFLSCFYIIIAKGQLTVTPGYNMDSRRIDIIVDVITLNLRNNGWSTILCLGSFPDEFYSKLKNSSHPFAIANIDREDEELEDVVQYYSNTIVINLLDIEQYEDTILKVLSSPYWHPHGNVILYYHQQGHETLSKIFFSLWYYKAINAIIVQYDDDQEALLISHYSPYITDDYKLDYLYGCWTTRRIGMPVTGFDEGFTCEEKCHNVSLQSKLKANNLGTCIGFSIITVPYNSSKMLTKLNLFEEKSKDFHGYSFRAYVTEVEPLFLIDDHGNGSYTLRSRDGMIWTTMAQVMNFKLDLTPSASTVKKRFNFELNIKQIFDMAFRKADFYLEPIYLFDVAVVQVDYSFAFRDSGGCVLAHRAGFETTLFDAKSYHSNRNIIIQFLGSFICIWVVFSLYQWMGKKRLSFDQIGKDFLNTLRNVLLITLCNPPRQRFFRIFLTILIWSFFVINFASQAKIVSFLTAAKRGKEVETFEDMIDKGYNIYGVASPDLILPDTEERFRKINSKLVSVQDLFACIRNFTHDKERFCLIDCSVGRYLERNKLNKDGEQYLHIAEDRIHSHYLTFLHIKHSPITERFDKYLMAFYEAGLIRKWEQYRYNDIKEEAPIRPLGMQDFKSLFDAYCYAIGFIFGIFLLELIIFNAKTMLRHCLAKIKVKHDKSRRIKIR